jgi:hypothetical protein
MDLAKSSALAELYHQQFYSDNPIKYKTGTELLINLQSSYLKEIKEEILVYACEFINWGKLKNIEFQAIKESFKSIIGLCPDSKESVLLLELKDLIDVPEINKLKNLKDKLFNSFLDQSSDLHVIVTMYLISMAILLLNQGKLEEKHVLYDLYEYGLTTGVLLNSGRIPERRFSVMVNIIANFTSEKRPQK